MATETDPADIVRGDRRYFANIKLNVERPFDPKENDWVCEFDTHTFVDEKGQPGSHTKTLVSWTPASGMSGPAEVIGPFGQNRLPFIHPFGNYVGVHPGEELSEKLTSKAVTYCATKIVIDGRPWRNNLVDPDDKALVKRDKHHVQWTVFNLTLTQWFVAASVLDQTAHGPAQRQGHVMQRHIFMHQGDLEKTRADLVASQIALFPPSTYYDSDGGKMKPYTEYYYASVAHAWKERDEAAQTKYKQKYGNKSKKRVALRAPVEEKKEEKNENELYIEAIRKASPKWNALVDIIMGKKMEFKPPRYAKMELVKGADGSSLDRVYTQLPPTALLKGTAHVIAPIMRPSCIIKEGYQIIYRLVTGTGKNAFAGLYWCDAPPRPKMSSSFGVPAVAPIAHDKCAQFQSIAVAQPTKYELVTLDDVGFTNDEMAALMKAESEAKAKPNESDDVIAARASSSASAQLEAEKDELRRIKRAKEDGDTKGAITVT